MTGGAHLLPVRKDSVRPFFSVVTTPGQNAQAVRDTLAILERQVFRDFSVVVLDDGNVPDLAAVVAGEMPAAQTLRVLSGDGGIAAGLNAAVEFARGRYVAFLEPGDTWHPRYLSYQSAVFEALPDALYSRTGCSVRNLLLDLPASLDGASADPSSYALEMLTQADMPTRSCFAAPRSLLLRSGGFNGRVGAFVDRDIEIRLLGGLRTGGRLSCEEHPAPRVPQILAMTSMDAGQRDLADNMVGWFRDFQPFVDSLYERPFMQRFLDRRKWFEARLIERHCQLLRSIEASLQIAA